MRKTIMKTERYYFQAGLFICIGLIALGTMVFLLGKERHVFTRRMTYKTHFTDTQGLSIGAPVRLGGITIGEVSSIAFASDPRDQNITVELLLSSGSLERIRKDSRVQLKTQGLLGDQFITISPGSDATIVAPGETIPSVEVQSIDQALAKANIIVDDVSTLSKELTTAVEQLRNETLVNVAAGTESIARITKEIETGDGFLHRLIYSDKKDGSSKSIENILSSVTDITNEIKNGKGMLHALVYEPEGAAFVKKLASASGELGSTAQVITSVIKQIKDGDGLIHDLIYSSERNELSDMLERLATSAAHLEKTTQALASGSGTLGALIVDPSLYENLVEVTDDAKRSFLLRQAIRGSLKK
jgi:phospholipid/cholesterol/gamma-HCH transport system substrate-binding protein